MTSAGRGFAAGRGSKIDEKEEEDEGGGMTAVTEMGLWSEKKDAMWISGSEVRASFSREI